MHSNPAGGGGNGRTVFIRNVGIIHPDRDGSSVVQTGASVTIKSGRIGSVGHRKEAPSGAEIIDGTGKWLLPGFIDAHVHFFQSGNPYTRPDAADLSKLVPYAQENRRNHDRLPVTLRTWLACGVTGVMDMGGPFWNFSVREEAARSGAAPRVMVTGPLFSTISVEALELDDPPIIKVSSVEEVGSLADRELARGPDFLKAWFIHMPGDDLAVQEVVVKEAGDRAHAAGLRLAVHATELDAAKAALRCGADILVHSVADRPVDDEFLSMARDRRAIYVPTLYVPRGYYEVFSRSWRPTVAEERLGDPEILAHMRDLETLTEADLPERLLPVFRAGSPLPPAALGERWVTAERNLVRVWKYGITVAMGTDAGNIGTLHGPSIFREMKLMVHAGLGPAEVLRCATTNGAIAMNLDERVGRVAEGYAADLIILNSNPLENIESASDISHVLRSGRVYTADQLTAGRSA